MKTRRRLAIVLSAVAAVTTTIAGFSYLLAMGVLNQSKINFAIHLGISLLLGVAGGGAIGLAGGLAKFASILRSKTRQQLSIEDKRLPILYLRSFAYDAEASEFHYGDGFGLPGSNEAKVVSALKALGPSIAIASSNVGHVPGGAVRWNQENWQESILSELKRKPICVIRPGETNGIRWELKMALIYVPLTKILLYTPRQNLSKKNWRDSCRLYISQVIANLEEIARNDQTQSSTNEDLSNLITRLKDAIVKGPHSFSFMWFETDLTPRFCKKSELGNVIQIRNHIKAFLIQNGFRPSLLKSLARNFCHIILAVTIFVALVLATVAAQDKLHKFIPFLKKTTSATQNNTSSRQPVAIDPASAKKQAEIDLARQLNNSASALHYLARLTQEPQAHCLFGEAVAAFREASDVYARNHLEQDWARTQQLLGDVLCDQARRTDGPNAVSLLGDAVAAYREALTFRTRVRLPQDWARTQKSLGKALRDQALELLKEPRREVVLNEFIGWVENARSEARELVSSDDLGGAAYILVLGQRFSVAEVWCRDALTMGDRPFIQGNLAHALLFQGQYEQALAIYRKYWNEAKADVDDGRTFREYTEADFKDFEEYGLSHADLPKLKKALGLPAS